MLITSGESVKNIAIRLENNIGNWIRRLYNLGASNCIKEFSFFIDNRGKIINKGNGRMELVSWSEKYSVNNHSLDSQHKKLIGLINQLHTAMKQGRGKEILQKILDELITYTGEHFSTEERMMTAAKFPGYAEHKKEHDSLTLKVLDLQKKYSQGNTLLTIEIMDFLKKWLINHIEGMDKKYKDKIK